MIRFAGALPREGLPPDSCEDRFGFRSRPDGGVRVAVADGAGSTLFAGLWAELLTDAYVSEETETGHLPAIEPLQRRWFEQVTKHPLPWHQQTQLSRGAAAAFLGVTIAPTGKYHAVSVGDCLLLQVRDDDYAALFPVSAVADLASLPTLIATHGGTGKESDPVRHMEGVLLPGDSLFLMTDALGYWFLEERDRGRAPARWFEDVRDLRTFEARVAQLSRMARLKDDDKTLLILRLSEKV